MRGVSPLRLSSLIILLSLSCCWLQLSHAAEEGGKQKLYARPAGGTVDQRTDEIPTYSAEPVLSKYSDMRSNTKIPTSTVKEETVEKGYTDGHPPTPMTVTATPVSATSGIPGAIPVARSTKEGSARATAARDGADHLVSPSNHTTTIIDEVATSRESPQVLGTNSGASGIPKAVSTAKGEGNDEAVWEEEDRVRRENAEKLLKDAQERLKKESEEKEEEEARMREEEEDRRAKEAYDRKKEEAERKARVEAESRKEVERKEREEKERKEKEKEEAELKEREEAEREAREEADRKKKEAERKESEEADRKEAERKEREETARKEAERKEKEEVERKAREETDHKKREAERKEREEAERREKEEAERKEKEEADRKKKEAERREKEEADRKEAERKEKEEADRKKREAEETERKEREEADRKRQEAERKVKEEEAKLKEEAEREKEIEREGGEVVRNGTDLYEVEHANPRKEAEEGIEGGSLGVKEGEEEEHDVTESPVVNSTKADSERGRVQDQQERVDEDQSKEAEGGGRVDIPAEVTDLNQEVGGMSVGDRVKDTATRAAMVTRELWMLYGEPAKVEVLHATGIDSPLLEVYVASSLLFLSIVWALLKRRSLSLPKADDGVIWRFRASRLERPVCSTAAGAPAAAAVNTSSGGINEEQFMQLLQQVQYLAQMANYTTQSLQTFMEESQAKFNSLICDIAVLKQDLDEVDCELLSSSQQVIEHLTCRSLSNLTQEERSSLNEVSDLKKITSPKEDGDDQSVEEKENESPQYANGSVPSLPVGATADRRPHTLADTSISSSVGGVHPPIASGGPVSPVAETMKSSIASPGVHAAFTGPNYSPDATPSPPPAPHHEQQPKTEWDASPSVQIPGGPLSVSAPSNGVQPPTAGPAASVAAPSPQNTSSPAVSSSSAPPQPVQAAAPVAGYDDRKPDTTTQSAEASPLASPPSNGVPAAFAQPARFRPAPKRMPQARRQRPHPVQGATDPFASLMQVTGTAGGPARGQNKAYSGPPPPQ